MINPKKIAVLALNMTFSTAFHMTGLLENHKKSIVNQIYCRKKSTPISHERILKTTWLTAICLFILSPQSEPITAVKVVQIFAHMAIAIEAGKLMSHPSSAASAIIHSAPLDWITTVAITHRSPNHRRLRFAYWVKSNDALMASTLSFMKSSQRKRSQNQRRSFAHWIYLSFFRKINETHQIPIMGSANAEILNCPNPIIAASNGSIGDQMLAQMMTQIAL